MQLANDVLRLTFDPTTGALIGVIALDGPAPWPILDRPDQGRSFRLLVPTRPFGEWHAGGSRRNAVLGEHQRLTSLEVAADGHAATFRWDGVVADLAGPLDIRVTQTVTLDAAGARFELTIDNRSPYPVETVGWPLVGDVQAPPDAPWLAAFSRNGYARAHDWMLRPTFTSFAGYYGTDVPTQLNPWSPAAGAPMSPFVLLRGPDRGLCVRVGSPEAELVAWQSELHPGFSDSMHQRVPDGDTIDGHPVAVRFSAVQLPHLAPGERRTLVPIVLEPYVGDWHAGADRYREWRESWMTPAVSPDWAREPHRWLQFQVNAPDDDLRMRHADLVTLGADCARNGITAIQLTGWNDGGQDQGNPTHDVDPRLGTAAELRDAIAAVRAMGVHVVLFTKFTWADLATARYRKELAHLAVRDPYGDAYQYAGYAYQSATNLLEIAQRRFVPMCFLAEGWLRVCEAEFAKVLALDPDGILYDESQHHMPALQCFDRGHGHRAGAFVYANDRELIARFRRMAEAAGRPDLLYASEDGYDWEFDAYDTTYLRSDDADHRPLTRYLLPTVNVMTALTGFDDREMVNQALRYRYLLSHEPFNFKGRPEDAPRTLDYAARMEALRKELRARLWDAACRDTVGARVTVDGAAHAPYSVFHGADGARTVVIANDDLAATITAHVTLDGGGTPVRYRLVDDPTWHPAGEGIVIPPRSAAVVLDGDA